MRLAEIAELLAHHGGMRASIELLNDEIIIAVNDISETEGEITELTEDVQRLTDLAQIQLFSERYGVPPEKLESFLTGSKK